MLADMPGHNVDAACQVAHALSTHKVDPVDDRGASDNRGAGMIGTVEFNAACFCRYAVIDTQKLIGDLDGDKELARAAIEALIRSTVEAIPTGKQNTFAAHNPPELIAVAVRDGGARNLVNAFEQSIGAATIARSRHSQ